MTLGDQPIQDAGDPKTHGREPEQQTRHSGHDLPPTPPRSESPPPPPRNSPTNNKDYKGITAAIEIIGILLLAVYTTSAYRQWREMSSQTELVVVQIAASSRDAAIVNKRLEEQLNNSRAQVDASRKSAEAIQRQMRQDQRAWIVVQISQEHIELAEGKTPLVHLTYTNTGKTFAKKIAGFMVIEVVNKDRAPRVRGKVMRFGSTQSVGAIAPQSPQDFPVSRQRAGKTPSRTEEFPLGHDELEALTHGNAYVAIYGTVNYRDIFGIKHWTHFCRFATSPGVYAAKACADFNDVDDNN